MPRFYFFTEIDRLANQAPNDAFGPVIGFTDTQFRVTSIHRAAAGKTPRAFAVCDGLVCAQTDDQGTLTLILKPSVQPPFDFPAISYILYKGIDPSSLLAADGKIDVTQEADNELISAIKAAWEVEANANIGSPTRECVGLHLNPADYPDDDNPERFADTEPLDRLFYEGDPVIQLPLVRGGGRLGTFSSSSPFGIEIIVERIGRQPKTTLARKVQNMVEVDALAATPSSSEVFLHWDKKEAILDFVDPCAFWGSFFAAKLRAWNSADDDFDKLSGNEIYETLLRGTASGAAKFANRNRAYIDIRNEHGNSLNYYQADGPNIQLTLDPDADIDGSEVNYYASGWPSFFVDSTNLPAGTTGNRIAVRFALPKTADTRPLIYVSAGYRSKFRRLKDRQRFIDCPRRADSQYLEEASVTILVLDDGGARIASTYQKIISFKRPLIVSGVPAASDPNSLAPNHQDAMQSVFRLLSMDQLPSHESGTVIKSFSDECYLALPAVKFEGYSTRLTIAIDAHNYYMFLVPRAYYWRKGSAAFDVAPPAPSFETLSSDDFLPIYVKRKRPGGVGRVKITPPNTTASFDVAVKASLSNSRAARKGFAFDQTIVFAFSRNEISQAITAFQADNPVDGSAFLTLTAPSTFKFDSRTFTRSSISVSFLGGATVVSRKSVPTTLEIYADADL